MSTEINSFFKLFSSKINDFFEIHPKVRYNNVFNEDGYMLSNSVANIRGISSSSINELNNITQSGYMTDMLITKQIKEKIDNIGIGYDGKSIYLNSNNTKTTLYDGLNFIKNNNKVYSTYAELGATSRTLEDGEFRLVTEEYDNIYADELGNIILNLEATLKISGSTTSNYDRKMFVKSHYSIGNNEDINFSVSINDKDDLGLPIAENYNLWFGYRLANDTTSKRIVAKELYQNDDFVKMFKIQTSGSYSFNLYDYCSNNGIDVPSTDVYLCFYLDMSELEEVVVTPEDTYEPLYVTVSIDIK